MGAAHARVLVAEGAKVVIGDILDEEGKALADEIGDAARYVHLDVTQPEEWDAAVATAVSEFGKLNVLVNNAGIVALGQIGKFDMAKWQKVIDVNLTGTFLGMQAVGRSDDRRGRRIDHQRLLDRGHCAAPPMVHPYVASKWAVRGLTKSAALELGAKNNSGQLDPSGFHPHPDDRALPRRHGHHPARPARAVRGGVDVRGLPRQRRVVVTPPVRSSSWTAAWSTTFRTRSD